MITNFLLPQSNQYHFVLKGLMPKFVFHYSPLGQLAFEFHQPDIGFTSKKSWGYNQGTVGKECKKGPDNLSQTVLVSKYHWPFGLFNKAGKLAQNTDPGHLSPEVDIFQIHCKYLRKTYLIIHL